MAFPYDGFNKDDVLAALEAYHGVPMSTGALSTIEPGPLPPIPGLPTPVVTPDQPAPLSVFDPGNVPSEPGFGAQPMVPPSSPYVKADAVSGAGQQTPFVPPVPGQGPGQGPFGVPNNRMGRPGDAVQVANAEQDAASGNVAQATVNTELAKQDAQRALIGRQADVADEYTAIGAKADEQLRANRDQARLDAHEETGRWLMEMESLARQEPNHQRYWQNTDSFGKSLWLLGMAFSSAALIGEKSAGQRHNPVLEMLKGEIQKDVDAQKQALANRRETMKVKGDIMKRNQDERITDLKDDYSMLYQRLEGLKQAALLRANSPGPEDTKLAFAVGAQKLTEMQAQVAGHRADQAYQSKEHALQRAWQGNENAADRANRFAIASMEERGKNDRAAKEQRAADPWKDYQAISVGTGVRVVGADGKPVGMGQGGAMVVSKATEKAVRDTVDQAQARYDAMQTLQRKLKEPGANWDNLIKSDPITQQAIVKLGYAAAKDFNPDGRISDKDFPNALRGALGADLESMSGRVLSATGIGADAKDIAEAMDVSLKNYPKLVSHQLQSQLPAHLPGYGDEGVRVDWHPISLQAPDPIPEDIGSRAARQGVKLGNKPLATDSQLEDEKATGAIQSRPYRDVGPGQKSHKDVVDTFKNDTSGAGTGFITQAAANNLTAVKDDPRAYLEVAKAARESFHKAAVVEHRIVTSGPASADDIKRRAAAQGVALDDDEAERMSSASKTAADAITWWTKVQQEEAAIPRVYVPEQAPGPNVAGSYTTDRLK